MVTLPINYYRKSTIGLTLIEVLVALAIVSIAMTAIVKAISQNIRSTTYLQDKTMAMYVGQQVLNEARVDLLTLPPEADRMNEKTCMLGRTWYWQVKQTETPNQHIKKIEVSVFASDPTDEIAAPIITMGSFLYHGT
jgi:general secretion pathway protein I